jgi:hypothetical protein
MRNLFLFSLGLLFSSSLVGCAADVKQADDGHESSEAAFTGTEDQKGTDVQVLQIWTPGRLFPQTPQGWQGPSANDLSMDANTKCTTIRVIPSTSGYENKEVECTKAASEAMPFDVTNKPGPMMTPARFTVTKRISDGYLFVDPDFCNRVEVRVVVREQAFRQASFAGVGFYTSRGDTFTPKNEMQEVGQTRLANGDDAKVFRFAGISTCISSAHSSTSGNTYQTFSFKPYAAYDSNNTRYRIWESIEGNHTIGRSWPGSTPRIDATAFDRQADLLAH